MVKKELNFQDSENIGERKQKEKRFRNDIYANSFGDMFCKIVLISLTQKIV